MADSSSVDWGSVDQQLKQKAGQWYDPSMLGDVQRNVSYGQGNNVDQNSLNDWVNRIANKASLRGSNDANSTYAANGQGGVTVNQQGVVNAPSNPLPTIAGGGLPGGNGSGSGSGAAAWMQSGPAPSITPDPQLKAQQDALYNDLMTRANQSTTIDPNDPIIRGQVDAFSATQQRQARNMLNDQAEKAGPYYNPTGNERMMAEQAGQNTGAFQASLMGQELTARRDQIQQALNNAQGLLTAEQQMDLQKQLGVMNAAIQKQSIGVTAQNNQNNYDLGLRNLGLNDWGQQMYWDAVNSGRLG